MFKLVLSENDKKWLQDKYLDLTIKIENGIQIVSGEIQFEAIYQDVEISDIYEIRIELQGSDISDLPKVTETKSRIKKVSEDMKIPLADLHAYEDGTTCLCVKLAEAGYFPNGFSFQDFMEELVVPYFYAQSYFEKFGDWPWEAYSHGVLGWLEWYFDQSNITPEITVDFLAKLKSTHLWELIQRDLKNDDGIKGHNQCICGSSNRYRSCHDKVFRGLWKLKKDSKAFGLVL